MTTIKKDSADTDIIQIPIPRGSTPSATDLEFVKAACQSVANVCLDTHRDWITALKKLEREDWEVNWGLKWLVEATKGRCSETASAVTIEEAFDKVSDLTRLHKVEGCP